MNGSDKRGVELTGYVKIPEDGAYTFYLTTDENKGSKAFVRLHGMELIDADKTYEPGPRSPPIWVTGRIPFI